MQELIIARGIQASGKTTAAHKWVSEGENRAAVSRDDIRFSLFGKYYDVDEKIITKVEDATISSLLRNGYSVFVHDTNIESRFVMRLALLGLRRGIHTEIREFDIDLEEALRRNSLRDRVVPEDVVRKTYDRWTKRKAVELPTFKPYEVLWDSHLMNKTVIFDIDGTLAKMNGRSPYDYSLVATDVVAKEVADVFTLILSGMQAALLNRFFPSWEIVIVSGRKSECRKDTQLWIENNLGIKNDEYELYMRAEGDEHPDSIVKYELFDRYLRNRNIWGVFDDRSSVVEMWRGLGLHVFQVAEGDF